METKKQFKYFTIFNHKKEEEYLRNMHKQGWKLVRVGGIGVYHFEKCVPEDVIYQLDYNPQTKETRPTYLQMFKDCGWEHILDYTGYSYFRKSASLMNEEESIFNDDESRTAMMSRVYKGRILPLLGIFCGCIIPQFILSISRGNNLTSAIYGGILALYIALFSGCAISHNNMKKK